MSYIVAIFLVFAGMLIRHFLSSGDRAGEEEARLSLTRENEELRGKVTELTNNFTNLDAQCSRQKGQLNVLQQLCDDWSTTREQNDRIRAQLEIDLSDQKIHTDKICTELELEKQKRITLEDQLHSHSQANIEKLTSLESRWRKQHVEVESSLLQRQADLASKTSENERLSTQLHQSQARVAELESQIKINERLLETAQKNASGLEKEYVTLETSMRESSSLLNDARRQCAEAMSVKQVAEESLEVFKQQQEELQAEYHEVRSRLKAAEEVSRQNESLKESIVGVRQELTRVTEQRDEAMESCQSQATKATGLQARIDNQEATIHGLRDSRTELANTVKQKELVNAQLEAQLAQKSADLHAQLKLQAETLTQQSHQQVSNQRRQREALESQLAQHDESLHRLTAERDALADQLSEVKTQLVRVTDTLSQREQSIQSLEEEVEEVGVMQVRVRELEALLQRRESEMQKLNVSSEEADLLRDQFSNLQDQYAIARRRQSELEESLAQLQGERQQDQMAEEAYRGELEQFRSKLAASADTIRTLRRERAAVLARLANYRTIVEPERSVISFTQAMAIQKQQNESYDEEYGGHTTIHSKRGLIYVSEPDSRDDLKRISGIAEVLEARLNDYGIYTFKQIMEWSPESIEEFSNLLTFRERIQRDAWQDQARYFYNQKHANIERSAA
jgi:predicted flap endonuclease-1-like 5' DNA nuclease